MSENKNLSAAPKPRGGRVLYDLLLVALVLLIALSLYLVFILAGEEGEWVVIRSGSEEISRHPLSEDAQFTVGDESGTAYNTVVISGGEVRVTEAGCPDKICKNHRPISKSGETIVCLPNKLVVAVE